LANQAIGPFPIVKKEGYSYRLKLPDSMKKLNPVFSADQLRRSAVMEPLTGQIPDRQPLIIINNAPEWEVEEIIAVKLR